MTTSTLRLASFSILALFTLSSCITTDGMYASSAGGLPLATPPLNGAFRGLSSGYFPGIGRISGMGRNERELFRLGVALATTAYEASLKQQREANARAQAAKGNKSIMNSVNANGAEYLAVPVKREPGQQGPQKIAKVRVKDNAVSSRLYDLPPNAKNGQVIGDSVLYLDKP